MKITNYMGENNAEVISIDSKPYFKYGFWWVNVTALYSNKNINTSIRFNNEDDSIAMTIGYKFSV